MDSLYLSVDLGGTSLRIGVLNAEGKILAINTLDSDLVRAPEDLVSVLAREFIKLQKDFTDIAGAGLGIPGLVSHAEGMIYQSPHFPQWKNFSLKTQLEAQVPFPIFLENDANMAALGETTFGAGKNWPSFVMITLGTGIGGGIIYEGKIFHGESGFAGEIGHMVIDKAGLPGALGIKGTLETFASLSGLRLQLAALQKDKSMDPELLKLDLGAKDLPERLVRLAKSGNTAAQKIWDEFGGNLACGLAALGNTLGIFHFVIGGGLAGAWDLFYPPCLAELPKRMYQSTAALVKIVPATLGNQAGLMGGVPLIMQGEKD